MGAYDGAEICELVGLFILFKFQQLNKIKNFSLYRDDGLAVVKHMSGPQSKNVKKELQLLFKKFCLNLIIECNDTTVDYLDITLNELDKTYKTISKPRKNITVNSQRIQSPFIYHQTISNYNRNTTFKSLIKRNNFLSCSRRL